MTLLKPSIAQPVASIIGGTLIVSALGSIFIVLIQAKVPFFLGYLLLDLFIGLGLLLICAGVLSLRRRPAAIIEIDSKGLTVPMPNNEQTANSIRMHIPSDDIIAIRKDESFRGRLIAIELRDGHTVLLPIRHYCSLDRFLKICKEQRLLPET